jgi:hypothetical protein
MAQPVCTEALSVDIKALNMHIEVVVHPKSNETLRPYLAGGHRMNLLAIRLEAHPTGIALGVDFQHVRGLARCVDLIDRRM